MSQQVLVAIEIGAIALIGMVIGLVLGRWLSKSSSGGEIAVYRDELVRAQRRLRAFERAKARPGRSTYGTSARARPRQVRSMKA